MKASIVEIHKNYCIVMTLDGRFVRHDVPAGAFELGDEIFIEAAEFLSANDKTVKKPFGMFAKLAAGFAAIVILGCGTYFGIKYAGPGFAFSPVKSASQAAQAKTADLSGQEDTTGGSVSLEQGKQASAAEVTDSGSGAADLQSPESSADASNPGQSSSSSGQGSGQTAITQPSQDSSAAASDTNSAACLAPAPLPVLFEGIFKIYKNNIDILIDYPGLIIIYNSEKPYEQESGTGGSSIFTIKIKNMQKSTFSGNIDIIFTDKNNSTLQTSAIAIGKLGFNDGYTKQIQVEAIADSFEMTLYGSFNEP
jgi:hypothetical protein